MERPNSAQISPCFVSFLEINLERTCGHVKHSYVRTICQIFELPGYLEFKSVSDVVTKQNRKIQEDGCSKIMT